MADIERELLTRIDERTISIDLRLSKMEKSIEGNGQPGIVTRLAKAEEAIAQRVTHRSVFMQWAVIILMVLALLAKEVGAG